MNSAFLARPPLFPARKAASTSLKCVTKNTQSPPSPSSSSSPLPSPSASPNSTSPRTHSLSRRALLRRAAVLGVASLLPSCSPPSSSAASSSSLSSSPSPPPPTTQTTQETTRGDYVFDAQSGSFLPPSNLDKILRRDAGSLFDRCIVAAEIHDNAFTHAAQLAVIDSARRLGVESDGRPLMVGFEQFYTSHNDVLRRFVASGGSMTVDDLLQATDWDNTWGFDSTLYRPIFNYCQEHGIEMVGLNLPSKVTSFVAQNGIDALPPQIQSQLPSDMDFNNNQHFNHFADLMMKIAGSHGGGPHHFESQNNADGSGEVSTISAMLKRYYEVQVLWEEWMSYSAARCLEQFPDHRIVTLIGSAHVEERVGFPDRLEKRVRERPFTIVPRPVDWLSLQDDSYSIPDIYGPEENVADLVWYTHMA